MHSVLVVHSVRHNVFKEEEVEMQTLDLKGQSCPIPVLEVKKSLKNDPSGVCCEVDTFAAKENIKRLVTNMGYSIEVQEFGDTWKMNIHK